MSQEVTEAWTQEFRPDLLDAVPADVGLLDSTGLLLFVNAAWRRRQEAWVQPDCVGRKFLEAWASESELERGVVADVAAGLEQVLSGQCPLFDYEYRTGADYEPRYYRLSIHPLCNADPLRALIHRVETTASKLAEHKSQRLNRLYTVLSRTNEAIVRAGDRQSLYEQTCNILVEHGQLKMALVSEVTSSPSSVEFRAFAGAGARYIQSIRVSLDGDPQSLGTIGTALRLGRHDVCNDFARDSRMAPWQALARDQGYQSTASFPLRVEGLTFGALTVFAGEAGYFLGEETRLLLAIADDLSFAVSLLNKVTAERQASEALRQREEMLQNAQRMGHMGSWNMDLTRGDLKWSDSTCELFGIAPSQFEHTFEHFCSFILEQDQLEYERAHERARSSGGFLEAEYRIRRPDGQVRWMYERGTVEFDLSGEPIRRMGMVMDITDRKRQERMQANETKLLQAINISSPLTAILEMAAVGLEDLIPGARAAILVADLPSGTLNLGAAPSMPRAYWQGLEGGLPVGPSSRSCGTAAFRRELVIAADVETDELWAADLALARACEIRATWSTPVLDATGHVLGTFAVYSRQPGTPGKHDLELVSRITNIVGIAIERKRAELQREAHEADLADSQRALEMLSQCNNAQNRSECEEELLSAVCEIAVRVGGFRLAWVGYARDDEQKSIVAQAQAGESHGYLEEVEISWGADHKSGNGPVGQAIRTGKPVVFSDLRAEKEFAPWLETATRHGHRGILALPLKDANRTFGVLTLYLPESRTPMPNELRLLAELAENVSFGIGNLRARTERRKTQEAVLTMARGVSASSSSAFFENLTQSMVDALGADGGYVARVSPDATRATTLCTVVQGRIEPNQEFVLSTTPGENLVRADTWIVPRDAYLRYPHDEWLRKLKVQAFVGLSLLDASKRLLGMIAVVYQKPPPQFAFIASTLKIFAARAGSELERQKADLLLREQASLLDKAQDAIIVRTLDNEIVFWNHSAERLYGWTAQEAVGRSVKDLLYGELTDCQHAARSLEARGEWSSELQYSTRTGGTVIVESRWTLVRDEGGTPHSILTIDTDITSRKTLESQFLRSQRMESIGTLAGGIAHDLNNVLSPILMSVELLRMNCADAESLDLLEMVETSAQRGADLVKQVLSFARGVEGQHVEVNLPKLLREIQKVVGDTFPKSIDFRLQVSPEVAPVVGDPTQLHQVFLNLCVNARDAMPDGGQILISVETVILDETYVAMNPEAREGTFIAVRVKDTGGGIPPAIEERIFEPFFTTKELGKGTGLGLSTTLGIVKSHGGTISVCSEHGHGTTFEVHLPADLESRQVADVTAEPALLKSGTGQTVLVVDDEEPVRLIAQATLRKFGYRVLLAGNGAEAMSVYARHRDAISLVFTDMNMPVMDGASFAVALRSIDPNARILGSSGLSGPGTASRADAAGIRHFLAKPYTADSLLRALQNCLEDAP